MQKTENQDQHLSLIEKKMSRGVIIHLDNDKKKILDPSKNLFDQNDLELEYIICETKESFEDAISANKNNIKALIFDLLSSDPTSGELHQKDAEFIANIHDSFSRFNIPIFVYSGFLQALDGEYENHGTVFKVNKDESIEVIFKKISKFFNSGFIDVFSPNGLLNELLFKDLNLSFTKQFNDNSQIESIIDSIIAAKGSDSKERIQKVFQRIAIRSLMSSLLAPEFDSETGNIRPNSLNPVEHYLQRISPFEFWTGDIFLKNDESKECFIIITPRCNVASKSFNKLLVCSIELGNFPTKITGDGPDKINKALTDNPSYSSYDRFLPPSSVFEGGKVIIAKNEMIERQELSKNYIRVISLSDELTNEILGKFGAYFFRSGINPWDKDETIAHISIPVN
jgi:hypothetical protein